MQAEDNRTSSVTLLLLALEHGGQPKSTIAVLAASVLRAAYTHLLHTAYLAAPHEVGPAMSTLLILMAEIRRNA